MDPFLRDYGNHNAPWRHHFPQRPHGQINAYFTIPVAEDNRSLRFKMGEPILQMHFIYIWPHKCTLDINKASQTSFSILTTRSFMSDVSGQQTLPGNFAEEIMNFDLCQKLITSLGFSINWKKTLIPKTTADNVISRVQNQLNQYGACWQRRLNE